jgi:hypothetical protein
MLSQRSFVLEGDLAAEDLSTSAICYWIAGFQTILEGVTVNADQPLAQLPMLSEAQRPKGRGPTKTTPLSLPRRDSESTSDEYISPRNETEEHLARLWCTALNMDRVEERIAVTPPRGTVFVPNGSSSLRTLKN